jgi:L-aspartate oxidase
VRSNKGLEYAGRQLTIIEDEVLSLDLTTSVAWHELRNMITCAQLIVRQSSERKENRGGFFNKDLQADQVLG